MSNLQLQIMKSIITTGRTAVRPAAVTTVRATPDTFLCLRSYFWDNSLACFPPADTAVGAIKTGNVPHPSAVLDL